MKWKINIFYFYFFILYIFIFGLYSRTIATEGDLHRLVLRVLPEAVQGRAPSDLIQLTVNSLHTLENNLKNVIFILFICLHDIIGFISFLLSVLTLFTLMHLF